MMTTLTLTSVTLREIALPLKEPFQISSGVTTNRRICLLQLKDADGCEGWSECVAGGRPNYSPETSPATVNENQDTAVDFSLTATATPEPFCPPGQAKKGAC